jgi:hypothetical protein
MKLFYFANIHSVGHTKFGPNFWCNKNVWNFELGVAFFFSPKYIHIYIFDVEKWLWNCNFGTLWLKTVPPHCVVDKLTSKLLQYLLRNEVEQSLCQFTIDSNFIWLQLIIDQKTCFFIRTQQVRNSMILLTFVTFLFITCFHESRIYERFSNFLMCFL